MKVISGDKCYFNTVQPNAGGLFATSMVPATHCEQPPVVKCLHFDTKLHEYMDVGQTNAPIYSLQWACKDSGWGESPSKLIKYLTRKSPDHMYMGRCSEGLVDISCTCFVQGQPYLFNIPMDVDSWLTLTQKRSSEAIYKMYSHLRACCVKNPDYFPPAVKVYIITPKHLLLSDFENKPVESVIDAAETCFRPVLCLELSRRSVSGRKAIDNNSFEIEISYCVKKDAAFRRQVQYINARVPCHAFLEYLTSANCSSFTEAIKSSQKSMAEEVKKPGASGGIVIGGAAAEVGGIEPVDSSEDSVDEQPLDTKDVLPGVASTSAENKPKKQGASKRKSTAGAVPSKNKKYV